MNDLPLPTAPIAGLRLARAPGAAMRAARPDGRTGPSGLDVAWARDEGEVREAQRLRYLVFVEEMGARLALPPHAPPRHDVDRFDPLCEHLLVRAGGDGHRPGPVVGTYRVLTPEAARRAGGLYSDGEFDLTPLRPLRARMVELGRSCVHPHWRGGGAILALWGALAEFMLRNRIESVIGCASIGMRDGGHFAAGLWQRLSRTHLASAQWQVTPRLALGVQGGLGSPDVEPPALIKGYLRCGARVLGPPAWDPDFNTADLPLLLRVEDLPTRYRQHFLDGRR